MDDPFIRSDDPATTAKLDQYRAEAREKLKTSNSYILVTFDQKEDGTNFGQMAVRGSDLNEAIAELQLMITSIKQLYITKMFELLLFGDPEEDDDAS